MGLVAARKMIGACSGQAAVRRLSSRRGASFLWKTREAALAPRPPPARPRGVTASIIIGEDSRGAAVPIDVEELLATRLLVQGNSGSGKSHCCAACWRNRPRWCSRWWWTRRAIS
jgi:hypothetical protein